VRDGLDRCLACFWMLCVAPYGTLEPNGDRTGRWYRSPRESGHSLSPGRRLHARRPTRREQPTTSPFPASDRAGSPPCPPIDAHPQAPRPGAPGPAKAPPRPPMSTRSRDPLRGFRPHPGPARRHVASSPGGAIPQRRTPGSTPSPPACTDNPTIASTSRRTRRSIDPHRDSPHIQHLDDGSYVRAPPQVPAQSRATLPLAVDAASAAAGPAASLLDPLRRRLDHRGQLTVRPCASTRPLLCQVVEVRSCLRSVMSIC